MSRIRISALTVVLAVLLNAAVALGQTPARGRRNVELPVYQWLTEPDRQEIPVKLRVLGPVLTFEQRQQLRVLLVVNGRALQKKGAERDLHFLMKVADESGHWYSEENYGNTAISAKLAGRADLEMVSDAYFEPGDYTIAIIVHDAVQNQRTVLRRQIRVPRIKNDPLPHLSNGLPRVEFLPDPVLGVASLGQQGAMLPLHTTRPIHIDLIVDFGAYREYVRSRGARLYASKLLQTSQVVSRIRPTNGCLEVSAVDILRTEIFFRRRQASELRWWDVREQILGRNLDAVHANVLGARLKTASLFAKFLGDLLEEPATCGQSNENLERVVLIVASGVAFPPKAAVEPVQTDCDCRIYYLRQVANPFYPFDDLPRLLKHMAVRKTDLNKPEDLRRRLAEMLDDMQHP